jgi:hypothetical protein
MVDGEFAPVAVNVTEPFGPEVDVNVAEHCACIFIDKNARKAIKSNFVFIRDYI